LQKRFREAAAVFGEILARAPADGAFRTDFGSSLAGAGETAKAEAEWRKAIEIEPHLADPHAKLIASHSRRGETEKALEYARGAAAAGAESPELYVEMGRAYAKSGDLAGAGSWLEAALRLRPDYPQALGLLGKIAYDQGRVEDALARYRAALAAERDPGERERLSAIIAELSRRIENR
jgi:Flp pilus assembly protein TadD